MKKLLCFLGGALLLSNVHAQQIKQLHVGDTIPPLIVNHVINHNDSTINLHQNCTATIIDFFETHCGGCIQLLPYLDSIQKKKKDSLSIIVVSDEPENVMKHFLQTNPNVKGISLPFVTDDTLLNKLFKHHSIPHEVWIGKDHVVKAITSSDYITKNNIEKLCEGLTLQLPVKNDYFIYDPHQPLSSYITDDRLLQSSLLTGYADNLPKFYHSVIRLKDSIHKKIIFTNSDLLSLISTLLENKFTQNRFILNVKDSSMLLPDHHDESWYIRHSYCYEITVKNSTPDSAIIQYALADIGNALNLKICVVKKLMPCYELIKTGNGNIDPRTKGGREKTILFPPKGKNILIRNRPVSVIATAMNSGYFGQAMPIVIDGTNDSAPVDIELPLSDIQDYKNVGKALRSYGYGIVQTNKSIDMVLIRDLNKNKKEE